MSEISNAFYGADWTELTTSELLFLADTSMAAARGEQPDSLALPNAGALRGDVPLSSTSESEVK